MTDRSAGALAAALRSPDRLVRLEAARLVGEQVVAEAAPLVRAALADEDAQVRGTAAWALSVLHGFRGDAGDAEVTAAVAGLVARMRDPDDGVRRAAIAALARIADPSVAIEAASLLDDPAVSDLAERALHQIGSGALPAAEALAVTLRRGGPGADPAARVLVGLGPAAMPHLGRLLEQDEAVERVLAALPTLGVFAAPLLPEVARHAHATGVRGALAARVLVAIGPDAWDVLAEVFDAGRPEARVAALSALDLRASPDLVGLAVRALFDDDPRARVAALHALSGDPDAARPFLGEIALLVDDPSRDVRTAATSLLALLA